MSDIIRDIQDKLKRYEDMLKNSPVRGYEQYLSKNRKPYPIPTRDTLGRQDLSHEFIEIKLT